MLLPFDNSKLRKKLAVTDMMRKTLAAKLGVSTKTVGRMLKHGRCSEEHRKMLAVIFDVEESYFHKQPSRPHANEPFVGRWISYFVESDGTEVTVVKEEIDLSFSSDASGSIEATLMSKYPDGREEIFRNTRIEAGYLVAESYIANWVYPTGLSVMLLRMLPNQKVLAGYLSFIDETLGHVCNCRHIWIRKDCTDKYITGLVDSEINDARERFQLEMENRKF